MGEISGSMIYANTHDFKNNISRYLRMLQTGKYKGLALKRHADIVAVIVPYRVKKSERPVDFERIDF